MSEVALYMASKHRKCESQLTMAVACATKDQWADAKKCWDEFVEEELLHMLTEDEILYPEFEQKTGMTNGPTAVLKQEHVQIRERIKLVSSSVSRQNLESFLEHTRLLKTLMQKHNLKEEQILYPLSARTLPDTGQTIQKMQAMYEHSSMEPGLAKKHYSEK